MTKDEALKMALETLEIWKGYMPHLWDKTDEHTITAIKEALAQPEQEPEMVIRLGQCANQDCDDGPLQQGCWAHDCSWSLLGSEQKPWMYRIWNDAQGAWGLTEDSSWPAEPLYTTPPQRKPLSEEEIGAILEDVNAYGTRLYTFARAIEAAHGIKGEA